MSAPLFTHCCASVVVYTNAHSPERVSERLGVAPTAMAVAGRVVGPNRVGRWRVESRNVWLLDSATVVSESSPLDAHLDWLVDRLSSPVAFRNVVEELSLRPSLRCVWWHARGRGGGPTFQPAHLRWIADCQLSLELDLGGELQE